GAGTRNQRQKKCEPMKSKFTKLALVFLGLTMFGGSVSPPTVDRNLIGNGSLKAGDGDGRSPKGFDLTGDVAYGVLGEEWDRIGHGVRMLAGKDLNADSQQAGTIATTVVGLKPENGRWFRLRIQGMAQDNFAVAQDELYLQVEFFRDAGKNALDKIKK